MRLSKSRDRSKSNCQTHSERIVNGSTELLSYSRKVINVPASRWITSTSGWTYVSSITGDYIDQTDKKVKGYLKIYKCNCLTGNSIATNANARVQASATGNNCDFGVSGTNGADFCLTNFKTYLQST